MPVIIHDIQISKHTGSTFKFNIPPRKIREGKLSVDKRYNVACYGPKQTIYLKNKRILVRKGEYPQYRITADKNLVDYGILKQNVYYTLEWTEV